MESSFFFLGTFKMFLYVCIDFGVERGGFVVPESEKTILTAFCTIILPPLVDL